MVQVLDPLVDHAYEVDLVDQVHLDLVDPCREVAFFVVSRPVEDPSSF